MGIPDNTLSDIIEKVKSWIRWGVSDHFRVSQPQWTSIDIIEHSIENSRRSMCSECQTRLMDSSTKCHCQNCGEVVCEKCMQGASVGKSCGVRSTDEEEQVIKYCKYCEHNRRIDTYYRGKFESDGVKSFQSDHLLRYLEAKRYDPTMLATASNDLTSSVDNVSPVSFNCSSSRSDDEDADESGKHFFSVSSEYCRDNSDIDSRSSSARHEFFNVKLLGSSPLDSPSRTTSTPRSVSSVQQEQGGSPLSLNEPGHQETVTNTKRPDEFEYNENPDYNADDLSIFRDQCAKVRQPLNFQSNGLIWLPPPPDGEEDEMERSFFGYDDEDDDVGDSGSMFKESSLSIDLFPSKGQTDVDQKEPLRAVVHGHFRALVLQLLQGEGIYGGDEDEGEGWLDIVTSLARQAASFVKPDTKRGGSMDPGDYVKVKCIESGIPSESTLIKGVVCTKNIKHKRMTSQYKNPKLLLLGGALEYQKTPTKLASFDTLLQQEIDHLKMIVSKIEAYHPNVLLVEKSVSSYAQEYLLAKEISLVLNVKRSLLERVARCTGAHIVPSIDNLSSTRLGHCEVFRLERVVEERVIANQPNKKSTKTLMFFEGCPRRLGCTVLLRGAHMELLKKLKRVVQYAVFAAYHLSLETSFLADEGATLLKMPQKFPVAIPGRLMTADGDISLISNSSAPCDFLTVEDQSEGLSECDMSRTSSFHANLDSFARNDGTLNNTDVENESASLHNKSACISSSCSGIMVSGDDNARHHAPNADSHLPQGTCLEEHCKDWRSFSTCSTQLELVECSAQEEGRTLKHHWESPDTNELTRSERDDGNGIISECVSAVDNHQSILVSFSSHCMQKGTLCERSQLLRIKFYGSFDKPLGRYLRDELFNQAAYCRSCKESTDAHVRCYTHQQGSLTINVRRLTTVELPGEHDGKIWMWHRCLKCALIDGVPPANRRVLMSDAAWGLSFGKFLELSFSNHATANRVASCGHSLQRDCLRFYGFGSMVAFFRYSPIDILSVRLPPSILEFSGQVQQEWVKTEAIKLYNEMEVLYAEVFDAIHRVEQKRLSLGHAYLCESEFLDHISDLKKLLKKERNEYEDLLHPICIDDPQYWEITSDILELNRLRRCLLMDSYIWDHRLYSLDSLLKHKASARTIDPHILEATTYVKLKECRDELFFKDVKLGCSPKGHRKSLTLSESPSMYFSLEGKEELCLPILDPLSDELMVDKLVMSSVDGKVPVDAISPGSLPSPASCLSDKIDSAWTGTGQQPAKAQLVCISESDVKQTVSVGVIEQIENHPLRMLRAPVRVHSFDSAMRIQEKIRRGLSPSLPLSSLRSFHASGEFVNMVRDPIPNILRTLSQASSRDTQKLSSIFNSKPLFIPSASKLAGEGVRLLLPQTGHKNIVIPVYDNEPTSVVSYVLCSKVYEDWTADKSDDPGGWGASENREDDLAGYHSAASAFSAWQSFSSLDSEDILFRSRVSDDASSTISTVHSDRKQSPHFRVSFEDEYSSSAGKVKFSVVCYFARQFDSLRKKCCPHEVDFVRSLSRCKRWNAQGGKSNVYFAKSLDERFIIKQVTKTELDSFEEFAPQYFKYLSDSLSSGSPTCLAKVLGIYQVTVKHLKGGKQTKMEFMVMENLFFKRNISRVYDLKGSTRSRYNPDTTGKNKVLLDMNLLQTLQTEPIFLSSKAKRSLERAIWNDTSFLASVDVMDYSLLVGVDDEGRELVLGIIDFMRQYTWDKHLETWVKASGILGGPKNTPPTVISPLQYKKRFRKAMSTYFLTVPDQWSS